MIRIDSGNANDYRISFLLQKGVYVKRPDSMSVAEFLRRLLNISDLAREVGTVFTDNGVVDDLETADIGETSSLVVSGAMPGLVGAMLRSDSPYKSMRTTITSHGGALKATPMIRIKLFNTVLKSHASDILEHGFWIDENEV